MDSDEREIFDYLKTWGEQFVNAKEVCRRASTKKRYADDNDWAKPILHRMAERHILEHDSTGRYRVKPEQKKHKSRWVSPDIEKILKDGGVEVEPGAEGLASDEHYEQL